MAIPGSFRIARRRTAYAATLPLAYWLVLAGEFGWSQRVQEKMTRTFAETFANELPVTVSTSKLKLVPVAVVDWSELGIAESKSSLIKILVAERNGHGSTWVAANITGDSNRFAIDIVNAVTGQ
jgi:hypothetical protein